MPNADNCEKRSIELFNNLNRDKLMKAEKIHYKYDKSHISFDSVIIKTDIFNLKFCRLIYRLPGNFSGCFPRAFDLTENNFV